MNNIGGPPERSGGIDFDESEVHAQDVIGRDKIDIYLPANARGCYAQLAKNIKLAIFFGVLMLLIYALFQINRPTVVEQTPTPTAVETATPTPTGTPEPASTPTVDDQLNLQRTATVAPGLERTPTLAGPGVGTPPAMATSGPAVVASSTRSVPSPTAQAVRDGVGASTPVPRSPTPTMTPTATRVPPTPVPSPRPSPTAMPRPPTPTSGACPSAAVRVGPVARLVTRGDTFAVSAIVSCAVDLAGYQVELRFDPSVVVVRDASDAGFLASAGASVFVAGPDVDNAAGKATIGAVVVGPGPYPGGSGTLASFTLEAVGGGSSDLDLGVSLSNANGQAIPVSVSGGAVAVQPRPVATPDSP